MKSLFCLRYRLHNGSLGVVIIEAGTLLEARMFAAIDGLDRLGNFSEGYDLNTHRAMVPNNAIGRMLSPGEAAWIEGEVMRKGIRATA
jgi:hypothetical protein